MKNAMIVLLFICGFYVASYGQNAFSEKELHFTPAEVESMLFLYNHTTVKGTEVGLVAPVGAKLKAGLTKARALKDTTKTITLNLNPNEIQICLNIINNSTFEAKYAELVLGMKRKLVELLPSPPDKTAAAKKKGSDKK